MKYRKSNISGLSPIHAPGALSPKEAFNLYYGERHTDLARLLVARRFLRARCIGDFVGVFINDPVIEDYLSDLFMRDQLGEIHIPRENLGVLGIHRPSEADKPHIVFLKFLLWLYDKILEEKKLDLIERLGGSEIILYFTPPRGSPEKSKTILLPSLDSFIGAWLDIDEKRSTLLRMRDSFYRFSREMWGRGRDAQDTIRLFAKMYEMFSFDLMRTGYANHTILKNMVSIVIDAREKYGVFTRMHYLGVL
jgi:hypothetical protein